MLQQQPKQPGFEVRYQVAQQYAIGNMTEANTYEHGVVMYCSVLVPAISLPTPVQAKREIINEDNEKQGQAAFLAAAWLWRRPPSRSGTCSEPVHGTRAYCSACRLWDSVFG